MAKMGLIDQWFLGDMWGIIAGGVVKKQWADSKDVAFVVCCGVAGVVMCGDESKLFSCLVLICFLLKISH